MDAEVPNLQSSDRRAPPRQSARREPILPDFRSTVKCGKIERLAGRNTVGEPTVSLAKTTRPSLESSVPRERLFTRLDSGLEGPITWVQGPPGSGKTTLVSSFLDHREINHLWYQIDPDDNDVATFFYYLRSALVKDGAGDDLAQQLARFSSENLHDVGQFARSFFRHMYQGLAKPFVFVLDSYQDVQGPSRLNDVIHAAISELPHWGAMLFMSRSDPAPQMARLRANRQMELITWDDLRLSKIETEQLATLHGRTFSHEAIESLYALTEGWAAGLVLLMQMPTRDRIQLDEFGTMTMDVIFDYFAEEAFNTFPATTQEFLLKAACMPKMTVQMAEDLTGLKDAADLLAELTRKNYFVSERTGEVANEYQFHPLFREFLMKLAQDRYSEGHYQDLQRAVAQILLANDQFESAVEVFLDLSDWDRVAEIIASHASSMLVYGRSETLAQWLDELPTAELHQNPWMLYWSAAARFHSSPRESRQYFERAYQAFEASDPADIKGMVLSCCGASETILIESDDFTSLDTWITRSEALLEQHPTYFEGKEFSRVSGTMLMAVVIRQPHHPMLDTWIARVTRAAKAGDDSRNMQITAPLAAFALLLAGRLTDARQIIRELRDYCDTHAVRPQAAVIVNVVDSMDRMLSGITDKCMDVVDGGLETAAQHGYRQWVNLLLVFGAGTALIENDLERAWVYLDKLEAQKNAANRLEACMFQYFRAWASLISSDKITAYQSFKTALSLAIEIGMPLLEALSRSGLARVAFDCDDRRTATTQLRKVHGLVRNINNPLVEFQTLMTYADLALGDGRTTSGLNALRYGLSLGREHGFEHVMGWQPDTVANLCVRALEEDIESDYVRRLISNSDLTPTIPPYCISAWPWRYRIYSFGTFKFLRESRAVTGGSRSKGRPLDVLKVLLARGGKAVKAEQVAESLWPHVDPDYGYKSFTINLHRLRKLFGDEEAVSLQDGEVALNTNRIWFDVWALEQTFGDIDAAFGKPLPAIDADHIDTLTERLFELYGGPFW